MTKVYSTEDQTGLGEDIQIKVTETKDIESFTSVQYLKDEIDRCVSDIAMHTKRHNELVDELQAINDSADIDITVSGIPAKITDEVVAVEK